MAKKMWKPVEDYQRIDLPVAGTWLGIREQGGVIGLGNSEFLIKAKMPTSLRVCELVDAPDALTVQPVPMRAIGMLVELVQGSENEPYYHDEIVQVAAWLDGQQPTREDGNAGSTRG